VSTHHDADPLDHIQLLSIVEASGALLASTGSRDVLETILDVAARVISADAFAVWRRQDDRTTWHLIASRGLSDGYGRVLHQQDSPGVALPETPIPIEDLESSELVSYRAEVYRAEGIRAMLTVPMRIHGELAGTIVFYHRAAHHFSGAELKTGAALGNLISVAIGMAELYEHQRMLRENAEASQRRSTFLAEASALVASSLDYEAAMAQIVDLSVPAFADLAAVDVMEKGAVRRMALKHLDPEITRRFAEAHKQYPQRATAPGPAALHTGRSLLVENISDEFLASVAPSDEFLPALRALGWKSYIAAPMVSRTRVLGLLTFITAESDRRYSRSDLQIAEELARRAAAAIENAELYSQVRASEERFRMIAEQLGITKGCAP
jgi:GAF domain-containing protein